MKTTFWTILWLGMFAGSFSLPGCSGNNGTTDQGEPDAAVGDDGDGGIIFCEKDEQCPDGMECRGGVCEEARPCDCNYDCGARGSGLVCNRGSHSCEDGAPADDSCSDTCDCYANEACVSGHCVPTGGDATTCDEDADCPQDQRCVDHRCVQKECTTREDCDGDVCLVCVDGECVAPPPVCQTDDDCCWGYHCNFGTCIPDAEGECLSDADCEQYPDRPRCVDGDCMPECTSDLDCAGGKVCIDNRCQSPGCTIDSCDPGEWCDTEAEEGMGACRPGCDQHSDCQDGQTCNYDTHTCVEDCCGGCGQDQYCDPSDCSCKNICTTDEDCPDDEVCDVPSGRCVPGGQEGTPCQTDADCAPGYLCDNCSDCDYMFGPPATFTCCEQCSMTDRECTNPDRTCYIRILDTWTSMCVPAS